MSFWAQWVRWVIEFSGLENPACQAVVANEGWSDRSDSRLGEFPFYSVTLFPRGRDK